MIGREEVRPQFDSTWFCLLILDFCYHRHLSVLRQGLAMEPKLTSNVKSVCFLFFGGAKD